MFEASLIKCINCDIFYELNKFFEKDIKNMRDNHKFIVRNVLIMLKI